MSFREKSAALTVFSLILVFGGYFIWAALAPRSQDETVWALVQASILIAVVTVIGHVAMAIASGRAARERADERDRIIGWRAGRNAYFVLMAMVWLGPTLAILHADKTAFAHAFLGALLAAEIANYGSRLYYYRRGF